jgi:hypothetical protein
MGTFILTCFEKKKVLFIKGSMKRVHLDPKSFWKNQEEWRRLQYRWPTLMDTTTDNKDTLSTSHDIYLEPTNKWWSGIDIAWLV